MAVIGWRRLTAAVLTMGFVTGGCVAAQAMSAQDWFDTIRPPLKAPPPASIPSPSPTPAPTPAPAPAPQEPIPTTCPGVGRIAFEPGTSETSPQGRAALEALIAGLTSPSHEKWMFSIEWLANPQTPAPLTNSRAAAIESALRANPALPPERLSFAHAPGQLKACPDRPAPETLLLQLDWAGRWYGGE